MSANHKDRKDESRTLESREFEERMNNARKTLQMDYYDALHIPLDKIPDGMDYAYVRTSILDKPDNSRMAEMSMRGWTPVPASRHPEMSFSDFFGRNAPMNGYIYHKGSLLCERPTELGILEKKKAAEKNWIVEHSLPGIEEFKGIPGMNFSPQQQQTRGFGYEPSNQAKMSATFKQV